MLIISYVDDNVNIDDLGDAKTVNYTNNVTIKTPKKVCHYYRQTKSKKSIKILNKTSMKK